MDEALAWLKQNPWAMSSTVSVLIACIGWRLSLRIRRHRRLFWRHVFETANADAPQAEAHVKEIRRLRKKKKDLRLITFFLHNKGTEEVLGEHVHRPLTISFGVAKPISTVVVNDGGGVLCTASVRDQTVVLDLELLNPESTAVLTILVEGVPQVSLAGSVRGVGRIEGERERAFLAGLSTTIMFGGLFAFAGWFQGSNWSAIALGSSVALIPGVAVACWTKAPDLDLVQEVLG